MKSAAAIGLSPLENVQSSGGEFENFAKVFDDRIQVETSLPLLIHILTIHSAGGGLLSEIYDHGMSG